MTGRVIAGLLCGALILAMGEASGRRAEGQPGLVALVNHSTPDSAVESSFLCGGVIVAHGIAATAAHCVRGRERGSLDLVVFGGHPCDDRDTLRLRVHNVVLMEDKELDLALLEFSASARARPARLGGQDHELGLYTVPLLSEVARGAGTGCAPERADLLAVDDVECAAFPRSRDAEYMCAVGRAGENTCSGDSGSPIYGPGGVVAGITLGGAGCGPDDPSQYLRADEIAKQVAALKAARS